MYTILTPSRELGPDVWLSLVMLGLAPAVLASWLQARLPAVTSRLPLGWYGWVLSAVTVAGYLGLGERPRLLSSLPLGLAILLGIGLGGVAIGVELLLARLSRRGASRRPARARPQGGAAVPTDLPGHGDVVWRLREHGPSWSDSLANQLVPAVLEEFIYRQILFALLTPVVGLIPAVTISLVAFGLIHLYFGVGAVISKLLIGGVFTVAVLSGAGLLATIVAHLVLNAMAYAERRRLLQPLGWDRLAGRGT